DMIDADQPGLLAVAHLILLGDACRHLSPTALPRASAVKIHHRDAENTEVHRVNCRPGKSRDPRIRGMSICRVEARLRRHDQSPLCLWVNIRPKPYLHGPIREHG